MKKRNPYLTVGLVMTGILTALIVLGFFWTPYDPNAMAAGPKLTGPSLAHLMGTDSFGRDIFSRVLKGAGTTYGIALCTVAVGAVCGTVLGAVTGYFGGIVDDVLMRLGDVLCISQYSAGTGGHQLAWPWQDAECDPRSGAGVHSQLCPDGPWYLRRTAGGQLCKKRPTHGGIQQPHPVAAYPA